MTSTSLFTIHYFRRLYPPLMAEALGITLQELAQTQSGYLNQLEKSTDFFPGKFLRHISKSHTFPFKKLCGIYYKPELYKASLFPDTIPALKKLKPNFTLGIYSEGYRNFQITKLKLSGILNYFNPNYICIHRRKVDPMVLNSLPNNSVIVDDKFDIITHLTSYSTLKPVWLNRGPNPSPAQVPTFTSLLELATKYL